MSMNSRVGLIVVVLYTCVFSKAFTQDMKPIIANTKIIGNGDKSDLINSTCLGDETAPSLDLHWKPLLSKKKEIKEFHPEVPNEEKLDSIKDAKQLLKNKTIKPNY